VKTRARDLRDGTVATPSAAQLAAMDRAVARAREIAALPRLLTVWVHPPPGCATHHGVTAKLDHDPGTAGIWLNATLTPERIFEVMLHELGHAIEPSLSQLPTATLEARATEFAARAMRGATSMKTRTNGHDAARRQALGREGRAIADRADREHRGFTAAERRRADQILRELDSLRWNSEQDAPGRQAPSRCLVDGAPLFALPGGAKRCLSCGMNYFGGDAV